MVPHLYTPLTSSTYSQKYPVAVVGRQSKDGRERKEQEELEAEAEHHCESLQFPLILFYHWGWECKRCRTRVNKVKLNHISRLGKLLLPAAREVHNTNEGEEVHATSHAVSSYCKTEGIYN